MNAQLFVSCCFLALALWRTLHYVGRRRRR